MDRSTIRQLRAVARGQKIYDPITEISPSGSRAAEFLFLPDEIIEAINIPPAEPRQRAIQREGSERPKKRKWHYNLSTRKIVGDVESPEHSNPKVAMFVRSSHLPGRPLLWRQRRLLLAHRSSPLVFPLHK